MTKSDACMSTKSFTGGGETQDRWAHRRWAHAMGEHDNGCGCAVGVGAGVGGPESGGERGLTSPASTSLGFSRALSSL